MNFAAYSKLLEQYSLNES